MDTFKSTYKGWTIIVTGEESDSCANFSFDISSPTGYTQHVKMGGENALRAEERAREMIDLELSFEDE